MKRVAPRFINLLATLGAFSLVAARGQQPRKGRVAFETTRR
jgi:hypothetical protein